MDAGVVVYNGEWKERQINEPYQEMAEHYGTAIIPAHVSTPRENRRRAGWFGLLYFQP